MCAEYLVREGKGNCCGNGRIWCNRKVIVPGAKVYKQSGCQSTKYECFDVIRHDDTLKCWILKGNFDDSSLSFDDYKDESIVYYYNKKYGAYNPIGSLSDLYCNDRFANDKRRSFDIKCEDDLRAEYADHYKKEQLGHLIDATIEYRLRGELILTANDDEYHRNKL